MLHGKLDHIIRFGILVLSVLLFSFLPVMPGSAQHRGYQLTTEWNFESFQLPGGAPGNGVQDIVQDSLGYLYFGSGHGLHRFDGKNFKTYLHDPYDSTSISDNYIEALLVDREGIIWISTMSGGLNRFNPIEERFTRFPNPLFPAAGWQSDGITALELDNNNNIWMGTIGNGLYKFNPVLNELKHYLYHEEDPRSLSDNVIGELHVDKHGVLWIGAGFPWIPSKNGGLNRYNPDTDDFTRYLHDPDNPATIRNKIVWSILEDRHGNFWVGTAGDGLHLMDRSSGTFKHFPFDPFRPNQLSAPNAGGNSTENIGLRSLIEDHDGKIWGISNNKGLIVFDPVTMELQRYSPGVEINMGNSHRIPSILLWNVFQSRDGIVWLAGGTPSTVSRAKKINQAYEYMDLSASLDSAFSQIGAICESLDRKIWIAGLEYLLMQVDPVSNSIISIPVKNKGLGDKGNLVSLFQERQGVLWIGSTQKIYRQLSGEPTFSLAEEMEGMPFKPERIQIIKKGKNGRLLIGANNGLFQADEQLQRLENLMPSEKNIQDESSISILDLFRDKEDRLWVLGGRNVSSLHFASNSGFFGRWDEQKQQFITHLSAKDGGLLGRAPFDIVEDGQGFLWIASLEGGLHRYDPDSGEVSFFNPREGNFPEMEVQWLLRDQDGALWIGSPRTIYRFQPESGQYLAYHFFAEKPGGTSINNALINYKGELVFSWGNGFYTFRPDEWKDRSTEVALTELWIGEEKIIPGPESILSRPLYQTNRISLKHWQNTFGIGIGNFHYANSEFNQTEFKLEPYQDQWESVNTQQRAIFRKIPPGNYIFRVRGVSTGSVQGQEKILSIRIYPPWWRTLWAYVIFGLLILGMLWRLRNYEVKRQLNKVEAERLKELDIIKTKLYTNITHEFRTPLTIILGISDQLKEDVSEHAKASLQMIRRNGRQLLHLVNQMLDLSKLEAGHLKLALEQGDIISYLRYLMNSFQPLAGNKNIRLHFFSDLDEYYMDFDPSRINHILSNLLSNAIKFTSENGDVYITVARLKNPESEEFLEISVKDNGVGITAKQLTHIFDRFFQGDVSTTRKGEGSGIGLTLTKELVKLMGGTIAVKSKEGKGAEFIVTLPVSRNEKLVTIQHQMATFDEKTVGSPAAQPMTVGAEQGKPVLLIVEDNPDLVHYLHDTLEAPYKLLIARNGQEGIDQALEFTPDLIVSDVMMPIMDGLELTRTLKKDFRTSHIQFPLAFSQT